MAFQARMLVGVAVVLLCLSSVAAQATPSHFKGKGKSCSFRRIELSLPFTPISADRIFPSTPDIKDALIATPIVRSFFLRPQGQPDGTNIATATVNAITLEPAGGNTRIANAVVNIKFGGGQYTGWVTGSGWLTYDFAGAAPAVASDYSITGGSGDFKGAVGTLTSTIVGTQGALVLTLDVPSRSCF